MRFPVIILLLLLVLPVQASTVLQQSFHELANSAEFIFEGRVSSISASDDTGVIQTTVVFDVVDIIKGSYAAPTVTLSYLGGTLGTRRLQVTDMELPALGESGIYFVESLHRNLVHPLVGWDQGRYLIEGAGGERLVTTAQRQPLHSVDSSVQPNTGASISKGIAKGVVVQALQLTSETMTVDSFKAAIHSALQE